MKKFIFLISIIFISIGIKAQDKPASWNYYAVNVTDSVVAGDTIYLKTGANIINSLDTLATLKLYLPTASTVKDGRVYHITISKKVQTLSYLNGTTVSLPTATEISEPVTKTGLNGKTIAVGGSFSIIYSAKKGKWYRCE